jgi:L-amino acid N-acyltransferase
MIDPSVVQVRLARAADSEAIRGIYNAEIDSLATFDIEPRSPAAQSAWLAEHAGAYAALVAEESGEVIGFGSLSRYRQRAAYATSVEDSVYVAGSRRGKGVGRLLLQSLVDQARHHGFHTVLARVVADNQASIALHLGIGFDLVGVEREVGRKHGRWLDVTLLQLLL